MTKMASLPSDKTDTSVWQALSRIVAFVAAALRAIIDQVILRFSGGFTGGASKFSDSTATYSIFPGSRAAVR